MATRVFHDSSFSTALARAGLRAFSAVSLFLLPLRALDYARFPRFFFFYCPCSRCTTRVFPDFSFSTAPDACILRAFSAISLFLLPLRAMDYARFHRFFFFYCPCSRCTTRVFRCFSFSTATATISYARFPLFLFFHCPCARCTTRVFTDFSFSTALARDGLRAFSPILLFLLPLHALHYARFPLFFFFYCPWCRYPTRVFSFFSFSTAPGACILRAFSAVSLFLLPRRRYLTRVFPDFSFSTAPARARLRAFSAISHFLLPLLALHYARFPLFLFFYCPCARWTTRVFRCFSFSTALARAALRAFSLISLFPLPLRALDYARFH